MEMTMAITVLTGPHKNRRFSFQGPVRCTIGRAGDCLVRFAGNECDLAISRHHCRLDIDPPNVKVRDLRSLNGTYLNGAKLEPAEADVSDSFAMPVKNGDVITLGDTSLRIDIVNSYVPAASDFEGDSSAPAPVKQQCAAC
jgi:pSer/pThr/pTyr-binding forkhead associated (FHA) protein